jgi:plastocyanin
MARTLAEKVAVAIVGALLLTMGCHTPSERHGTGLLFLPYEVKVQGLQFDPDTLTVARGTTVTWTFFGASLNTTTSGTDGVPDGHWDSPPSNLGYFEHKFDSAGVFPYFSRPHYDSGMKGWILVR